ncbi:uracil-DNA glycosylase [Solibacillus silvestris]|nr:uracil-DNA glycosylase [Solibacillus silvestris]OBW58956.1 uracil-DNA glycosylase [Solibacillus silvestris]
MKQLTNSWKDLLSREEEKPYYKFLETFLERQYMEQTVYPKKENIFNALQLTDYDNVKVVILGQDPYHGPNQAHGLSFSVEKGQKLPPSLKNMMKELQQDIGCEIPEHGDLTSWAKQGVLLLNTVLTVQAGIANSHKGQGWEQFTNAVIELLAKREQPIVFLLWGKPAQSKRMLIEQISSNHIILQSPHPSPLSAHRGFFGSRPYSKANEALLSLGQQPIDWCLTKKWGNS